MKVMIINRALDGDKQLKTEKTVNIRLNDVITGNKQDSVMCKVEHQLTQKT